MNMEMDFQVVSLDEVMRYFAKDFKLAAGRAIFDVEHFVDTAKGQVVFKLTTHDSP